MDTHGGLARIVLGLGLGLGLGISAPSPMTARAAAQPAQFPFPTAEPPTAGPPPAPTEAPAPPTDGPIAEPSAPPPAEPTSPPRRDRSDDDQGGEEAAPADEATTNPFAGPTRTRRPTRTPRGGVAAVGTPLPSGSLRVALGADPPVLVAGQNVVFHVELVNFGSSAAADLTLEITLPERIIVRGVGAPLGSVSRSGNVLHWNLAELEAGAETTLEIPGLVATGGVGRVTLCALLLSWGAPLDQCADFVTAAAGEAAGSFSPSVGNGEGAVGPGVVDDPTLLLVGMLAGGLTVALGVWLGLKWRARQKGPP